MLSVSGHKIHGPKGVGFLYIDEHVKIQSDHIWRRTAEEYALRHRQCSGNCRAMALAASHVLRSSGRKGGVYACRLKSHFVEEVLKLADTVVHGLYDETSAPHIISVGFAGVRSEVLLHALEDKGICVSSRALRVPQIIRLSAEC